MRALTLLGLLIVASVTVACSDDGGAPTTPAASPRTTATGVAAPTTAPAPSASPATPLPSPAPARVVHHGDPSTNAVALTFDAGADPGFTAGILRILRDEGIRATFGVTGLWAEANRDLLLAIAADGHQIINHTYDHRSFTGASTGEPPLSFEQRALELSRTETTVYRYTGRTTRPYFRPPYGDIDDSVLRDVAAEGYDTVVMWTVDTLGWNGASAAAIAQRSLDLAEPGAIYVMHVGSQSQDAAALPGVIAGLRTRGYSFLTIDELLSR